MTDNQQRAIDAIKAATGWDAEPSSQGAKVQRPNVTSIYVWYSRSDKWKCEITPKGWTGEGATPEEAIDVVLPRYRAQIANLAADILPENVVACLEWDTKYWFAVRLMLRVGEFRNRILTVSPGIGENMWTVEDIHNNVPEARTRTEVLAWATDYVESLKLRCHIPAFPETP